MLNTNDFAKLFDTIMSIPGMNEKVKIDMKLSRKNVLLLNSVIKRVLSPKNDAKAAQLLESIPQITLQELGDFADECITKAGLSELIEKLEALNTK